MLGWQNGEIVYFPCSIPGHKIKNNVSSDVISAPSFFTQENNLVPFKNQKFRISSLCGYRSIVY